MRAPGRPTAELPATLDDAWSTPIVASPLPPPPVAKVAEAPRPAPRVEEKKPLVAAPAAKKASTIAPLPSLSSVVRARAPSAPLKAVPALAKKPIEAKKPVAVVVEAKKPVAVVVEAKKPAPVIVEAKKPAAVIVEAKKPAAVIVEAKKPAAVIVEAKKPALTPLAIPPKKATAVSATPARLPGLPPVVAAPSRPIAVTPTAVTRAEARPAERKLAQGSLPPPASKPLPPPPAKKPLPSLFSVIDKKRPSAPPARMASAIVAASITAAPLAMASAQPARPVVPPPAQVAFESDYEELEVEPDLIALSADDLMEAVPEIIEDFVPPPALVPDVLPVPRPSQAIAQFSDAERAFFAAGDDLARAPVVDDDFADLDASAQQSDRSGFWSRLRSAQAR